MAGGEGDKAQEGALPATPPPDLQLRAPVPSTPTLHVLAPGQGHRRKHDAAPVIRAPCLSADKGALGTHSQCVMGNTGGGTGALGAQLLQGSEVPRG